VRPGIGTRALLLAAVLLGGCATPQPIHTVAQVDLSRFMGNWYVIANIPTFIEQDAYNAVESYRLAADDSIDTTFSFRDGGFDGEPKQYHPRGFVREGVGNAVWDMQFIWPFRAEYRIIYLSADYAHTIIGRSKRDYVWIMARSPEIAEPAFTDMLAFLAEQGYDISLIEKVPQRW
jgi:apolipoprotein D and lipocalin family protein